MASLDTTIANVAAPSIARNLSMSTGAAGLTVAAYTLFYASTLITGARLGADRGRRPVFLWGIGVFTAASTLAGGAPDEVVLTVARAAQGVGAALAIPQAISFIQAEFVGRSRARALAVYGTMIAFGASAGLAAGGALIQLDLAGMGWRTVYLVNLPVGVAVLVLAARTLPALPAKRQRFDLPGFVLLTVGGVCVTGALALGPGAKWPLASCAAMAAGVLLLAGFARWQWAQAGRGRWPLVHPAVFSAPGMRRGLAALLLSGTTYTGVLFCVAAYLQEHRHLDPLTTGLLLLPLAVGFGAGSTVGFHVPPRRHAPLVVAGLALLGIGLIVLAVLARGGQWPTGTGSLFLAVAGAGYGAGFSPLVGLTVAHVGAARIADASGIATTTFQFSFVLGVAGFGTVFVTYGISVALTAMGWLAGAAVLATWPFVRQRRSTT